MMRPALLLLLLASACAVEVEESVLQERPAGDEPILLDEMRGVGLREREPAPALEDASSIVAARFPTSLACGASATATVTVENRGTLSWTAGSHKLGAVDDSDPLYGPDPRVYLDAPVAFGEQVTFTFTLAAPAGFTGAVTTDWQMVHEGVRWFGPVASAALEIVCDDDEAPPPPPALPDMRSVVDEVAAAHPDLLASSCVEHGGNNGFLHALVDRLRVDDPRWGYNWKRGNVGDLSQDVVDYHFGDGDPEGSTDVWIVDVIAGHCGPSPGPAWIDVTEATRAGGTIGRWTSLGRF